MPAGGCITLPSCAPPGAHCVPPTTTGWHPCRQPQLDDKDTLPLELSSTLTWLKLQNRWLDKWMKPGCNHYMPGVGEFFT